MLERFAMINITKETSVSIDDVLHLYQAVGWTNYTNQPQMLEQSLAHSLAIYVARDGYGCNGQADTLMKLVNEKDWGITIKKIIK